MKITKAEYKLIHRALYAASDWELSLSDAWGHIGPESKRCCRLSKRYLKLRDKLAQRKP